MIYKKLKTQFFYKPVAFNNVIYYIDILCFYEANND